jgi:hypothetical protein
VLYYAGGNVELNGHGSGGSISALNPGTGAILWSHQTVGAIIGSPAYVNGMVAYGAGNSFQVVNAANGQLLYSYALPGPVFSAVSVARSQFYVGDIDGSVYAFGLPATPPPPPPSDPNCPTALNPAGSSSAPVCQDIGNPTVAGSESTSAGVLTVTGSGAPLGGTSDQFRFVSTAVTGDSQSGALIVGQASSSSVAPQAGLMVRQSSDPSSPFYSVLVSPGPNGSSNLVVLDRTTWGGNPTRLATVASAAAPLHVMIEHRHLDRRSELHVAGRVDGEPRTARHRPARDRRELRRVGGVGDRVFRRPGDRVGSDHSARAGIAPGRVPESVDL